jgi:hypothetical protein
MGIEHTEVAIEDVTLYTLGKKSNVNGSSSWPWFTQNCQ